ncbi:UrcA family protein [Novosphingobium terrae]|uniref:UrcA family protein n=1 Tax=Novosphingobium terrae TaxID=2726189 RepID=UPI00197EE019|nr:UrcA family protein [Novosphingobium terrae]
MNGTFGFIARASILALALSAAPSAFAAEVDSSDQAPRMEINLAGIDLTTNDGLTVARKRVSMAARSVCTGVVDVDGVPIQHGACVYKARAQGVQQLEAFHQQALAAAKSRAQYAYNAPVASGMKPN